MNYHVLTLFPEMITNGVNTSITGRAIDKKLINLNAINIRDFSGNKHGQVDDYPYGGGAGMLMQPGPVYRSYESVVEKIGYKPRVIYLTPQGETFNQSIDERVLEMIVTDNVSIGDYVLTGGELPAMVMIDTISRLIPGVLNNNVSAEFESFNDNLLEYPQYTRPDTFMDKKVPPILLSGDHAKVDKWRREQSIIRTIKRRPDLMEKANLTKEDIKFIEKLENEKNACK